MQTSGEKGEITMQIRVKIGKRLFLNPCTTFSITSMIYSFVISVVIHSKMHVNTSVH